MGIRGFLFDVDDTLFAYTAAEEAALVPHLASLHLLELFPSPAEAVNLWRRIRLEEYVRFLVGELSFAGQQVARTRRFLASIGQVPEGGLSDKEAAAWFAGFAARRDAEWCTFPDAEPTLEVLAGTYRLGVVSNSMEAHQRHKLAAIGLLDYFADAIICSDVHGAAKPAASIFHAGCAALDLPPCEVAYVGDVYTTDAIGARDAGLWSFWLNRVGEDGQIDDGISMIRSLHELPAVLAERRLASRAPCDL
jgi:putative hydrolase of the HAD superfamily